MADEAMQGRRATSAMAGTSRWPTRIGRNRARRPSWRAAAAPLLRAAMPPVAAALMATILLSWGPPAAGGESQSLGAAAAGTVPAANRERVARASAAADTSRFAASVVRIDARIVEDGRTVEALGDRRTGSGVILDENTVLTIGYLVMEADRVVVSTSTGQSVPASVLAYDHASGFGLLRTALPMAGQPLPLGDSDRVREPQRVLTIGQGEPRATRVMVVSRKPFAGSWEYLVDRALYTFPPVNNWSGSALIDDDGQLIGIGSVTVTDAATSRQGVPGNMFVPINLLKPILTELVATGRAQRAQPWIGLSTEVVRGNLMVTRVAPGGPAEQAGVTAGDIVIGVESDKVADQVQFYRRLWKAGPAGTEIRLRVLKEGDVRDMRVRSIDRNEFLRRPTGI